MEMEPMGDNLPYKEIYTKKPYLTLNQWSVADVDGDRSL